jgi:hypothetical protein
MVVWVKMSVRFVVIVSALVLVSGFTEEVYYIKPNDASSSCPANPCLTFDQYTAQQPITIQKTTLLFLAGNHSLHTTLHLINGSDIVLRGESNCDIAVLYVTAMAVCCDDVSKLTIQDLAWNWWRWRTISS